MTARLTIGAVARQSGVPAKTIRFYEAAGLVPAPARTDAGYRLYTPLDVRRLRLIRNARRLGVGLDAVKRLTERAFASDCSAYADQLTTLIAHQRAELAGRMAELQALSASLDALEAHLGHAQTRAPSEQQVVDCGFCPLIDEEGGKDDD